MEEAKKLEEGTLGNKTELVKENQNNNKDNDQQVINKIEGGDVIEQHDEHKAKKTTVVEQKAEEEVPVVKQIRSKRVATLDAFRGLTIVVLI